MDKDEILKIGPQEIITQLADDSEAARDILDTVLEIREKDFELLAIDLYDMQMRGRQIAIAFGWCKSNVDTFLGACRTRDATMIYSVNYEFTDREARQGTKLKPIPQIDTAVKSVIQKAEQEGRLEQMADDKAAAVNDFFLQCLANMQASSSFIANMTVNLGTDTGVWARFVIQLVELVDADGNPIKNQPQDELKEQQNDNSSAGASVDSTPQAGACAIEASAGTTDPGRNAMGIPSDAGGDNLTGG